MSRPFNKNAYDQCDASAKLKLKEVVEKNSNYRLISDINKEYYKLFDLSFSCNGIIVNYENEVRENFDSIVSYYDTIHIPNRKKETKCDFYIVWKPDLSEFISIEKSVIDKYRNNGKEVICNKDSRVKESYVDKFFDIPKIETKWFILSTELKPIFFKYP